MAGKTKADYDIQDALLSALISIELQIQEVNKRLDLIDNIVTLHLLPPLPRVKKPRKPRKKMPLGEGARGAKKREELMKHISEHGLKRYTDIAKDLGMPRSTVHSALDCLVRSGRLYKKFPGVYAIPVYPEELSK